MNTENVQCHVQDGRYTIVDEHRNELRRGPLSDFVNGAVLVRSIPPPNNGPTSAMKSYFYRAASRFELVLPWEECKAVMVAAYSRGTCMGK